MEKQDSSVADEPTTVHMQSLLTPTNEHADIEIRSGDGFRIQSPSMPTNEHADIEITSGDVLIIVAANSALNRLHSSSPNFYFLLSCSFDKASMYFTVYNS
ncbi:hypothetical protein Taro_008332 [Colocasia esculenta]|uniref:Uncharacterized protein n=1 Tax=Colocasia esculenta TaxID=4460 RepID=A0A843TWU9_COLES|nr:hypothetical protein [Colocasia esculenta]